jgi:hypothetical protein
MRSKTYLTPRDQWDRTAALVYAKLEPEPESCYGLVQQSPAMPAPRSGSKPGQLFLVRARTHHRLFLQGDVFVANYHANAVRSPIYGVSSRGYQLDWYWVGLLRSDDSRYQKKGRPRYYANRTALEWVELPGELVDKFPTDPDVRSFVTETLRAGASACG